MEKIKNINEMKNEGAGAYDQRYLKCWGCDYPYLESSKEQSESLVPAPFHLMNFKKRRTV